MSAGLFNKQHVRAALGVNALAIVTALALTACSHGGGSSTGAGKAALGQVVIQAGQGARLSGTYPAADFWKWVPTSGMYPDSLSEVPGSDYNTGDAIKVNAKYDPATVSCTKLVETSGGPGYGEEAYLIDEGENSAQTDYYAYATYEFATADQAEAFVKNLAQKWASCGTFTASDNGTNIPTQFTVGPASEAKVPAANAAVDLRESLKSNGKTLVADTLFAADGNVVVVESRTGSNGTLPTEAGSLASLAQQLLTAYAQGEAQTAANQQVPDGSGSANSGSTPDAGTQGEAS